MSAASLLLCVPVLGAMTPLETAGKADLYHMTIFPHWEQKKSINFAFLIVLGCISVFHPTEWGNTPPCLLIPSNFGCAGHLSCVWEQHAITSNSGGIEHGELAPTHVSCSTPCYTSIAPQKGLVKLYRARDNDSGIFCMLHPIPEFALKSFKNACVLMIELMSMCYSLELL